MSACESVVPKKLSLCVCLFFLLNKGGKSLKKLWCFVGGGNQVTVANLHFQLSWYNQIIFFIGFPGRLQSCIQLTLQFQTCVLKVSAFVSTKTKQDSFDHTSVFVLFSFVHTYSFSFENAHFSIRFRQLSTLIRPWTLMERILKKSPYEV